MKIKTQLFGEIEFKEDLIIKFVPGPIGFEQLNKFLLIKADDDIFYWLNSIEKPEIAFPLVGIRIIDDAFPEERNFEPFGIVTLNSDVLKITVNLKAPVYINQISKTGFQKILDTDKYPIRYNLFKE
jgi:flagellar assembly factor FliW